MDFKPNITPREIFLKGSFGGTYWRPLKSSLTKKTLIDDYKRFDFLKDLNPSLMTCEKYDKNKNLYKIKCGTDYEDWIEKGWIKLPHERGWVEWYCDFYSRNFTITKESKEIDIYQIKRWLNINVRFKKRLLNDCKKSQNDPREISPKICQTLLHWGIDVVKLNDFKPFIKQNQNY